MFPPLMTFTRPSQQEQHSTLQSQPCFAAASTFSSKTGNVELGISNIYNILHNSECCQPLHCQELQHPLTITAVMLNVVVVIKLIINQLYFGYSNRGSRVIT